MTNPRTEKIQIKHTILDLLKNEREILFDETMASLKLKTGFNEKVIKDIFESMVKTHLIKIEDNFVHLTETTRKIGEIQ